MTIKPIIFSGPMVRALYEGRKTQTRRPLKIPKWAEEDMKFDPDLRPETLPTPIKVRDTLWVRESITRFDKGTCDQHVWYRSGGNCPELSDDDPYMCGNDRNAEWPTNMEGPAGGAPYNVPSIFMPRWASRLTLSVTGVKVERLQDISRSDAIAEGVNTERSVPVIDRAGMHAAYAVPTDAIEEYASLWDSINGPGSWDANPWVAAYTFTVHHCNVDQMEAA